MTLMYHHTMSLRCVSLTSEQRLNVIATPAAFRSIGDLRCFLLLFTTSHTASPEHPPAIVTRRTTHWLSQSSASMPTSYRYSALPCQHPASAGSSRDSTKTHREERLCQLAVLLSKCCSLIFRLVNRSGLRLAYWVRSSTGNSTVHALNAWEESPLLVEPVQRNIVLAETQQQVCLLALTHHCAATCLQNCSTNWGAFMKFLI